MIRRYYEEEMRYLHEAGKAFAEVHPETARYLNVDSVTDRDPYVERLFEGFAFLTGRIHERLDDELPEFTESLCELLYPHFLRPVPALCLVELKPRVGLVQQTTLLRRGLEVRSVPVGDESAVCRFQTTQDVRVQPLQLTDAAFDWARDGTSSVRLRFGLERGVDYQRLELSPLRLHFHADPAMAATMHLFFTRHVRRVVVHAQDADPRILQGQGWVQPGGLAPEEGLLPYCSNSFTGFRLLQEYLCFRRKFWCIDLMGLEQFSPPRGTAAFEIEVVFDRAYPEDQRFRADNLRLHCTPVVNLFSTEAEPIRADGTAAAYQVVPSVRYRRSVATYDVEDVVGVEEATGKRHRYHPFFAFRQEVRSGNSGTTSRAGAWAPATARSSICLSAASPSKPWLPPNPKPSPCRCAVPTAACRARSCRRA